MVSLSVPDSYIRIVNSESNFSLHLELRLYPARMYDESMCSIGKAIGRIGKSYFRAIITTKTIKLS
jgi:hypothetical protein